MTKHLPDIALLLAFIGIISFFVANPLLFKYLMAMIGGSIQYGHL